MKFTAGQSAPAYFKGCLYGKQGTRKSVTAFILAQELSPGNVYIVDTENNFPPYADFFPNFHILATRSVHDIIEACQGLPEGSSIIVDQISFIWDGLQESYIAKEEAKPNSKVIQFESDNGTLPAQSWRFIKTPYRRLMNFLIFSPYHVFIVGRSRDILKFGGTDVVKIGETMRSEKETLNETHVSIKLEQQMDKGKQVFYMLIEKSRGKYAEAVAGNNVFEMSPAKNMQELIEDVTTALKPILDVAKSVKPAPMPEPLDATIQHDAPLFPDAALAQPSQIKMIEVLATKLGVQDVQGKLLGMTAEVAQKVIVELSKGKVDYFVQH